MFRWDTLRIISQLLVDFKVLRGVKRSQLGAIPDIEIFSSNIIKLFGNSQIRNNIRAFLRVANVK
jgi:hypothetical protein